MSSSTQVSTLSNIHQASGTLVGSFLNDRAKAIEEIRNNFLDPGFTHVQRSEFVAHRKAVIGENNPNYLLQLFEKFPEEIWPLVFVHFGEEVCQGTVQAGNKGFIWAEHQGKNESLLISICRGVLLHSVNNPRLQHAGNHAIDPSKIAINQLCRVAENSKIFECVLHRFFEEPASAGVFVPCMIRLSDCYSKLHEQLEEGSEYAASGHFKSLLHESLKLLKHGRIEYLISVLKQPDGEHEQRNRQYSIDIPVELWEKLLLEPENCAQVARGVIAAGRLEFLQKIRKVPFSRILENLNKIHPESCQREFLAWLTALTEVQGSVREKVALLCSFCAVYAKARCDVIDLLQHTGNFFSHFQPWFHQRFEENCGPFIFFNSMGLKLLYLFQKDTFNQRVLSKIESCFPIHHDDSEGDLEALTNMDNFCSLVSELGKTEFDDMILEELKSRKALCKRIEESLKRDREYHNKTGLSQSPHESPTVCKFISVLTAGLEIPK